MLINQMCQLIAPAREFIRNACREMNNYIERNNKLHRYLTRKVQEETKRERVRNDKLN